MAEKNCRTEGVSVTARTACKPRTPMKVDGHPCLKMLAKNRHADIRTSYGSRNTSSSSKSVSDMLALAPDLWICGKPYMPLQTLSLDKHYFVANRRKYSPPTLGRSFSRPESLGAVSRSANRDPSGPTSRPSVLYEQRDSRAGVVGKRKTSNTRASELGFGGCFCADTKLEKLT